MRKNLLFFVIFLVLGPSVEAEGIAFQVFPSSSGAIIGVKFPVKIKVFHPPAVSVRKLTPPARDDIVCGSIKYKKSATEDLITFDIYFYTIGETEVGPFFVLIGTKTARVSSFKVDVKGRLSQKDLALKGIRPQISAPFPWLTVALGVLILAGVILFFRLRKRKETKIPEKQISPEDWYLSALSKIDTARTPDTVADEISDIFRFFLEKKWRIPAIFLSSEELLAELKRRKTGTEARMKVAAFLRSCDLAKFAKKEAAKAELEKLRSNAEEFVRVNFGEAQI
ncbi:MAG: hypothetical protein J7L54_01490 [Elusimicrobia bacterium]|nr:hypothetical protein [Elusimicrobiota bacterium]